MNRPLSKAGALRAAKNVGATPEQMPQALAVLNGQSTKGPKMNARTQNLPRQELSPEAVAQVKAMWLARAQALNLPGPASPVHKQRQSDYAVGVLAVLDTLGYSVSPMLVFDLLGQPA